MTADRTALHERAEAAIAVSRRLRETSVLKSALNGVPDWRSMFLEAEKENAGLREAMKTRAVIEQAKGIIMFRMHVTEDEAFKVLVSTSQRSQRKLHDIDAIIVADTQVVNG